jgi:eukaryotic-like serine/threonine-protein kinase
VSQPVEVSSASGSQSRRRQRREQEVGPGTDVGSYLVEARLGAGGFGTVFRARRGGQDCALKLLSLAEVGPSAIREVLGLSRVSHRNVVRLKGFWDWPDARPRYLVVVMEYVPGRPLDVWASQENPSALRVLRLVQGVARALVAVHEAGLVHCDVKEANLIVREPEGEVVLVDFGVSWRQETGKASGVQWPQGTPDYLSPEAWRFRWGSERRRGARYRHTPADDLYALGVVLYWLLTDARPFCTQTPRGVEAVLTRAPQPPHERNPKVPRELSELCLRLLDKQPEARPRASEVCQRVEELLSRQGAAWEQPLCEPYSAHNVSTEGEREKVDELAQWLKQAQEAERRPRRGKRPPRRVTESPAPAVEAVPQASAPPAPALPAPPVAPPEEAAPAEPAAHSPERAPAPMEALSAPQAREAPARVGPEAPEPVPAAGRGELAPLPQVEPVRRAVARRVPRARAALGLGLLAAMAVLTYAVATSEHTPASPGSERLGESTPPGAQPRGGLEPGLPTRENGWKVAPPLNPPEAERAAPLAPEAATTAPVAPGATAQEDEASVNTPEKKQPQRLRAAKKAAAVLSTCATLGCTGPTAEVRPVRPLRPVTAEPCPPGSLQAMEKLGIRIGKRADGVFAGQVVGEWIKVNEGWTTVQLGDDLGELEGGRQTLLTGRLIFGEKHVWGHFVQATTKEGKTYPVCLEYRDEIRDGKLFSSVEVEAVREFK